MTDGVYVWPAELHYYVEKYHVRLPEDFVLLMEARGWEPPARKDLDMPAFYHALEETIGRR